MATILITGGAGYIGSHTCIALQQAGYDVIVVDNLDNSSEKSLPRVEKITGKPIKFYREDVRDILQDSSRFVNRWQIPLNITITT